MCKVLNVNRSLQNPSIRASPALASSKARSAPTSSQATMALASVLVLLGTERREDWWGKRRERREEWLHVGQ
jgi:hypothetical protein